MSVAPFNFHIRPATVKDDAELARLRWDFSPDEVSSGRQSFNEFREQCASFLLQAITTGNWSIWVAEAASRLVANAYLQIVPKVPRPGRFDAKWGYVTNVYVEPAMRNKGVGTQLLTEMRAWAETQRLEFLILWPSKESVRFYERLGFAQSQEILQLTLSL